MKVKICDSVPGSGKTEAAIRMINQNPSRKYIFVTPYLKECDRVAESCPALSFCIPDKRGEFVNKTESLHELIAEGKNIAHSHALFAYYTDETRELISVAGYVLILDEVMNVINKETIGWSDLQLLFDSGCCEVEEDGCRVRWLKDDYAGNFKEIMKKAQLHNLYYLDNQLLFWSVPVHSFSAFTDIYVLTYLFRAQVQRYYYEIHGIEFEYLGVRHDGTGYSFVQDGGVPEYARKLIEKVHVVDDEKANHVGDDWCALSSNWYKLDLARKESRGRNVRRLANMMYNVLHNKFDAVAGDVIWTTFKRRYELMAKPRYKNRFVSCTTRATNEYRGCHYLAYCVNIFMHPSMARYLEGFGIEVHNDAYAMSEMIQWVWRSAIRSGEDIWLYVPSVRMRKLFMCWLEALAEGVDPIDRWDELAEREAVERQAPTQLQAAVRSRRRKSVTKEDGD